MLIGEFMKNVIVAAIFAAAVSASAAQYVTVTDCNGGESGTVCREITYKVRPASPLAPASEVELVPFGEAGIMTPAPKITGGGLLKLLQNLSKRASSLGLSAPQDTGYNAGGN
jgi:hypothetical protein